jgi:uncharacterized hydantoinase/oxoprolinase family protein
VPLRNSWCSVAAEWFATMADVYCVLGLLPGGAGTATADGRPQDRPHSLARLARSVCGDIELLAEHEIVAIAEYVAHSQQTRIMAAIRRVADPVKLRQPPAILAGSGSSIARIACERAGIERVIMLDEKIGCQQAVVAPALAVAALAQEQLG